MCSSSPLPPFPTSRTSHSTLSLSVSPLHPRSLTTTHDWGSTPAPQDRLKGCHTDHDHDQCGKRLVSHAVEVGVTCPCAMISDNQVIRSFDELRSMSVHSLITCCNSYRVDRVHRRRAAYAQLFAATATAMCHYHCHLHHHLLLLFLPIHRRRLRHCCCC